MQILVEIGAHCAHHRMVDVLVQTDEKAIAIPGILELLHFAVSQRLFRARINPDFFTVSSGPWLGARANVRAANDLLADATVVTRIGGAQVVLNFTINARSIRRTDTLKAARKAGLADLIGRTRVGGTLGETHLTASARETPLTFALKASAVGRRNASSSVEARASFASCWR